MNNYTLKKLGKKGYDFELSFRGFRESFGLEHIRFR